MVHKPLDVHDSEWLGGCIEKAAAKQPVLLLPVATAQKLRDGIYSNPRLSSVPCVSFCAVMQERHSPTANLNLLWKTHKS